MRYALVALSFAAFAACATPLHAEPKATATLGEPLVEIAWNEPTADHTRIALALPPAPLVPTGSAAVQPSCSSVQVDRDRAFIEVSICRTGGTDDAPQLQLAIERSDHATPAVANMKLRASVRMRRGVATPIGRFERSTGPSEVIASLR